ncbi:unnamed protein product [Polarella glacialis]|uniref:SET domain-containing protein n=1 Tax=Polarella glacialis TaxID=89957 RepID=A0A813FF98_POLGL|nr:unnamed protein product [Polarella glacialis]
MGRWHHGGAPHAASHRSWVSNLAVVSAVAFALASLLRLANSGPAVLPAASFVGSRLQASGGSGDWRRAAPLLSQMLATATEEVPRELLERELVVELGSRGELPGQGPASRRDVLLGGAWGGLLGFFTAELATEAATPEVPEDRAAALEASQRQAQEVCDSCCAKDWCECDFCDCSAFLESQGYKVPLDAPRAFAKAGKTEWGKVLDWQSANIPHWEPVARENLRADNSTFPGAGLGLFTQAALPADSVLPPYWGPLLTFAEVGRAQNTPENEYVWCSSNNGLAAMGMSKDELTQGPKAREIAFCTDGRASVEQNLAGFVNAAASQAQCGATNVRMCELGQVMYFRTTKPVPAGSELVTDYGGFYWGDFQGCPEEST